MSVQAAPGLRTWAAQHTVVIAGGLLLIAGVAAILLMGDRVLSAAPRDIVRSTRVPS